MTEGRSLAMYECIRPAHHALWCTNSVGGLIRPNSVYVNRAELVDPRRNSAEN